MAGTASSSARRAQRSPSPADAHQAVTEGRYNTLGRGVWVRERGGGVGGWVCEGERWGRVVCVRGEVQHAGERGVVWVCVGEGEGCGVDVCG